ncbi:MAG: osmotically inducible protein OsmC [Calditrichaeota bacterium]|nr:osmotically inducible protein OsmC [Calditrichota bacterium]
MDLIVTFPGGKRVDAHYKDFTIKTDQPLFGGGENSAPAPFDLFLASLATCAGIYVLSFCQQRDIPTDDITIAQRILPSKTGRGVGTIAMEIQLPPDFPEQYKEAVIRAADLCAVKKLMESPPKFDIYTRTIQK